MHRATNRGLYKRMNFRRMSVLFAFALVAMAIGLTAAAAPPGVDEVAKGDFKADMNWTVSNSTMDLALTTTGALDESMLVIVDVWLVNGQAVPVYQASYVPIDPGNVSLYRTTTYDVDLYDSGGGFIDTPPVYAEENNSTFDARHDVT